MFGPSRNKVKNNDDPSYNFHLLMFTQYYSEGQRLLVEMRIKKDRAISDPACSLTLEH